MERRLAAILAADVVGYSRLMEQDEAGTFERLRSHRKELFKPEIEKHHGRVFKLMGDGLLAEFASVVDAVECSVALQRGMAERNSGLSENQRIDTRMGVHLGDVIVEDDDRHGDAVNVAARLQQLAEAGGICVSETVVNHVRHKVALRFEPRGEERLKNITDPVPVFRVVMNESTFGKRAGPAGVRMRKQRSAMALFVAVLALVIIGGAVGWWRPWEPKYEPASLAKMALPLPDKPSIAVLPFTNMSDDPKQDYFADGITEDIITDLSQISGLFVISRNSTFIYKGKVTPPKQVSEQLGVRYVLEGSVQRADQQVRINAQLIDATTGGHVWADRYEGSLSDIFGLQDDVTQRVADALALRLSAEGQQTKALQETNSPAAYEAFLRGWEHYRRSTPDDYARAIPYLENAIKLDPNYSRAYAALALIYFSTYDHWWHESIGLSYDEAKDRAQRFLTKAEEHPTSTSRQVAGNILRSAGNNEHAIGKFRDAIALDPSDSWNYAFLAETLSLAGRSAEAIPNIQAAMRLDPNYPPDFLRILGMAQFQLDQFQDAAVSLSKCVEKNPDDQWALAVLVAVYGYLARADEAALIIARYNIAAAKLGRLPLTIYDNSPVQGGVLPIALSAPADRKRLAEGLRMAGVSPLVTHSVLGEKNKLAAAELHSLVFGHELRGHDYGYRIDADRFASITADGIANFSGNWASGRTRESRSREISCAFQGNSTLCALKRTGNLEAPKRG